MLPLVSAESKVLGLLVAFGRLLRVRAATDAGCRDLLGARDGVFQIRVADGSAARWFGVRAGKVTSRAGVHPAPAAALVFGSAAAALTRDGPKTRWTCSRCRAATPAASAKACRRRAARSSSSPAA
jgi:hypothetical protein